MKYIILTTEQAQIVQPGGELVVVRDEQGRTVGHLTPLSPTDIADIEQAKRNRAAGGPPIPAARVSAFLRKLHEIEASEGIDQTKVDELLRRVLAGEPL